MSYEKVKRIRITADKVFITSASNNVWPRDYTEWESPRLSQILNEQGREAVDKEILFSYFEGAMQSVVNDRYQRTINRINMDLTEDHHEVWKNCGKDDDYRSAFLQRLYDNLINPPKKQPCCLERQDGYRIRRVTKYKYDYCKTKYRTYHDPIEAAYVLKANGLDQKGFKVVIL